MTLSDIAGGFVLTAALFFALAVILAVYASETHFHASAARARVIGWVSLGLAVTSALAGVWLLVANGGY